MNLTLADKNLPGEVTKYLAKYGMEGWRIESASFDSISMAVVIPAIAEYDNIRTLLSSLAGNDPEFFNETLILFVVNNRKDASEDVKSENKRTIRYLRDIIKGSNFRTERSDEKLREKISLSGLRVGVTDACSPGLELPEKEGGVGLARKIGMDLALSVFDYDSAHTPVLVCLDSDCTVKENYISEIRRSFNGKRKDSISAAVVDYYHTAPGNDESSLAIINYEIFLRYYVLGLKYSGSPFAFHTIGSTMICDYKSYIKIEGMNKRKAAEDFYFMEKLAKNCRIDEIKTTAVYPSSRGSWRVPFGTGQRVNRFLSHERNEYLLYSPRSFYLLKAWLEIFNSPENREGAQLIKQAEEIHPALGTFLRENNFQDSWIKILKNSKNDEQIQRQKLFWFDGFRTLKLIHYLRDNGLPQGPMFSALDEMLSKFGFRINENGLSKEIPDIETQREYLNVLRKIA